VSVPDVPLRMQVLTIARGEDVLITAKPRPGASPGITTIAGWQFKFALAETVGGVPVFEKTNANGITIFDPVERIIKIAIPFADTNALLIKTYFFDLWRIDTAEHARVARGTAVIEERVATLP
jgi:hypothetical protein